MDLAVQPSFLLLRTELERVVLHMMRCLISRRFFEDFANALTLNKSFEKNGSHETGELW